MNADIYTHMNAHALIQEAFPATQLQRTPSPGSECGESPYGASPLNSNSDFAAKAAAATAAATAAAEHVYSSSSSDDSDTDNDDDISSSAQGLRERLLQRKALQSFTSTSETAADAAAAIAAVSGSSTTR
jgi:hypothetical protein